ncbi:hypothetical protein D3C84_1041170 [compost metagenome]
MALGQVAAGVIEQLLVAAALVRQAPLQGAFADAECGGQRAAIGFATGQLRPQQGHHPRPQPFAGQARE